MESDAVSSAQTSNPPKSHFTSAVMYTYLVQNDNMDGEVGLVSGFTNHFLSSGVQLLSCKIQCSGGKLMTSIDEWCSQLINLQGPYDAARTSGVLRPVGTKDLALRLSHTYVGNYWSSGSLGGPHLSENKTIYPLLSNFFN